MKFRFVSVVLWLSFGIFSCRKDVSIPTNKPMYFYNDSLATKHLISSKVIVVIIDGPRYSETFGEPTKKYIPHMAALMQEGSFCDSFYNMGITNTVNGHTAICTGVYEDLDNGGKDIPTNPSFLQYWLRTKKESSDKAWIIASKDKLQVLANCSNNSFHNQYQPSTNCGVNGLGTGYRDDSTTFAILLNKLRTKHADVVLVNFKEPDFSGHRVDWNGYLKGIETTDKYIGELWAYLQQDPYYMNQTALFVTNDHGRHLNGWKDGFVSHGDDCEGCRHISLLALGPDFKKQYVCKQKFEQLDLCATVAGIFHLKMPYVQGEAIYPIFK